MSVGDHCQVSKAPLGSLDLPSLLAEWSIRCIYSPPEVALWENQQQSAELKPQQWGWVL